MKMHQRGVSRHLLLAILVAIALASLFAGGVAAQSDVCYDRKGNVVPCPERKEKPTATPKLPPSTSPTRTATPSGDAVAPGAAGEATASPTWMPQPTSTSTPLVAAIVPPGGSDPAAEPGGPSSDGLFVFTSEDIGPGLLVPGLFLTALLLLLVLLASRGWSLQGVLKHEAPQSADDILISGSTTHEAAGVQQYNETDHEFLSRGPRAAGTDGFHFNLMGHHMKPDTPPGGSGPDMAGNFEDTADGPGAPPDPGALVDVNMGSSVDPQRPPEGQLPLGGAPPPPSSEGFTLELKDAHVADTKQEMMGDGTTNANFATPADGPPPASTLEGTMTHELGHSLGLDHNFDTGAEPHEDSSLTSGPDEDAPKN